MKVCFIYCLDNNFYEGHVFLFSLQIFSYYFTISFANICLLKMRPRGLCRTFRSISRKNPNSCFWRHSVFMFPKSQNPIPLMSLRTTLPFQVDSKINFPKCNFHYFMSGFFLLLIRRSLLSDPRRKRNTVRGLFQGKSIPLDAAIGARLSRGTVQVRRHQALQVLFHLCVYFFCKTL